MDLCVPESEIKIFYDIYFLVKTCMLHQETST